ncbi:MAG: AAA family ATPase [Eubacteriales bacterium]|nr:AAA family ATPase [Eubacteriales bacterium]
MDFIKQIEKLTPHSPSEEIDWDLIENLLAGTCFKGMRETPQNPVFHAEGDVYRHTQMVCRELTQTPAFYELSHRQREELFLAALFHDIGKVKTTRIEDGIWVSPHHSATGSRIAREFLWRDCGLCGERERMIFRETVCALIRYHMMPIHLMEQENPEKKAREVGSIGDLAEDFSWKLLCMLAEADVKGRIAEDIDEELSLVQLAGMIAEENGCLCTPCRFSDSHTGRAYFSGRNVHPNQVLFDDTWGEVILLSGLPGTGKDTWIQKNCPGLPVVSLDEIRKEKRIKPTDQQGLVIQTAKERAREYLRKKQPFIWNATDLTEDTRKKLIDLFERYNAGVRIVYLETTWSSMIERNDGREALVPAAVINRMLKTMVPPMPYEARTVKWLCV